LNFRRKDKVVQMKFIFPMALAVIGMLGGEEGETHFACDRLALTAQARKRHFDELGPALREMTKHVRELPSGFEFEFPSDAATVRLVSEWAAGEHLCCPFFHIDLRLEPQSGAFWVRLTGSEGVKPFIRCDFAKWFKPTGK
jgi:hypothetical protein